MQVQLMAYLWLTDIQSGRVIQHFGVQTQTSPPIFFDQGYWDACVQRLNDFGVSFNDLLDSVELQDRLLIDGTCESKM